MLTADEKRTKVHLIRLYRKAGGCKRVAVICGVSEGVARAWRTPNVLNRIPFDALRALERATGDFECTLEHTANAPDPAPQLIDLALWREVGTSYHDLSDATLRALEDHDVNPREAGEILPLAMGLREDVSRVIHAASAVRPAAEAAE